MIGASAARGCVFDERVVMLMHASAQTWLTRREVMSRRLEVSVARQDDRHVFAMSLDRSTP